MGGRKQSKNATKLSTTLKWLFSWLSVCLVFVNLWLFSRVLFFFFPQSSDKVISNSYCSVFWCLCERMGAWRCRLCYFAYVNLMFLKDLNNKKKSHKNLPMLPFLMLSAPSCRSRFPYGIIFLGPEGHSLTFLIVGLVVMKILKDIFHWDIILIFFLSVL